MEQILYITDGFWREVGEPSDYPLMSGGPVPILMIVFAYLYLVRVLGPRWMKSREAFDLKWTIRLYNIALTLINFYCFAQFCYISKFGYYYFGCQERDPQRDKMTGWATYLLVSSKVVEMLDTVFFVMRKKYNQASNLHVFHHSSVLACAWVFQRVAPYASSAFFPFLNSGVHTVMYAYYFLATFKSLQPHLWWKRYLTTFQMVQFVICLVHHILTARPSCQYPLSLSLIGAAFMLLFIALFANFYYHSYVKKGKPSSKAVDRKKK